MQLGEEDTSIVLFNSIKKINGTHNVDFNTYVRFSKAGRVKVWLIAKVPEGKSIISITNSKVDRKIKAEGAAEKEYYAGEYTIQDVDIQHLILKEFQK